MGPIAAVPSLDRMTAPALVLPRNLFGVRQRPPRPTLMMIVFGLLLVIVGVTAMAQTILVSVHISTASLSATLSSDAATVRTFVNGYVAPEDLTDGATPDRIAFVETGLQALAARGEILHLEIRDPAGVVRLSSDSTVRGATATLSDGFAAALGGKVDASVVNAGDPTEALGTSITAPQLLREYFPLAAADGAVVAVVGIWRDAAPILAAMERVRSDVLLVTLSAAVIVAGLLFLIFRGAQARITRQTAQLVASSRSDALTGLLNHGTVVADLAVAIEAARPADGRIAVALIDLDNFGLLNDNHGHAAGDAVLLRVAADLSVCLPPDAICARYGPDEFLVVLPAAESDVLEPIVGLVRERLSNVALEFEGTERLPVSVSAAIATYPRDGASVTALLARVAVVVAEAQASGGDVVRVAGRIVEHPVAATGFDILHGLIIAVDTKDRYTKRHSEDVSRYGVFLARRLGLDEAAIETVRSAGLLHDVGKIGIPDAILRKPARLTDEEYEVVKRHVALGDAVLQNVEENDQIRAGVRHHHERWDGRGYLHALAGEDIPLVARILSIGDAFSAMTTTRPYRKALTIEEALTRLGDGAATQFDESLVRAFIEGIERDPAAPLPGMIAPAAIWVPGSQVA